jgi:hypothetical protein
MQNRKERRLTEKQMGLHKMEKALSHEQQEEIKRRKLEYVKQAVLIKKQDQENLRINEEAELHSKQIESLVSSGYTREAAEAILENNRQVELKRAEKKRAKEESRKSQMRG